MTRPTASTIESTIMTTIKNELREIKTQIENNKWGRVLRHVQYGRRVVAIQFKLGTEPSSPLVVTSMDGSLNGEFKIKGNRVKFTMNDNWGPKTKKLGATGATCQEAWTRAVA